MPSLRPFMRADCLELGIDEVARGCLTSEVVSAAVLFDPDLPIHPALNDSKKMTPRNREIVREWIEDNCLYGIGTSTVKEIDELNIQRATYLAMHRAIAAISVDPEHLVVDGTGFDPYFVDGRRVPFTCVPQGDGKFASVAAASVLAKQHRDGLTAELVREHPELEERYSLGRNKGYGSAEHIAGIHAHGPSRFHRMSFAPAKHFVRQ